MSPQARFHLPPELSNLGRADMEKVISEANIGRENEQLARLYFIDRMPQADVAAELYLGAATVKRRLPFIKSRMEVAAKILKQ